MAPYYLSPIALFTAYLRRCFSASGLSQQTLRLDDETTIRFWAPKPGPVRKPALVLLHGFGPEAVWQWRRQVQFFSPVYHVYVPDLIFFGGSTTTAAERTEVFQAAAVGRLMERVGVERYEVMGTSYGGFVAYHVARMWPERVGKVVVASSGINMRRRDSVGLLRRGGVEEIEKLMLPETAGELRALLALASSRRFYLPDFFLNDFVDKLYLHNRKEKIELLKGVTLGREDTPNITPLQQEVLIVWGEHDHIFPLEMATELKEIIGKKTRLEVIKNASHVPQIEQTQKFNHIVKSFLCPSP